MKKIKNNIFNKISSKFFIFLIFSVIIIKFILGATLGYLNYFVYEAPFYDTGTFMSLLICLEHIYVSYYLIIIIIMVYWSLYVFLLDFLNWSSPNYNKSSNSLVFTFFNYIFFLINNIILREVFFLFKFFKMSENFKFFAIYIKYDYLGKVISPYNYMLSSNFSGTIFFLFNYKDYLIQKKLWNYLYASSPRFIFFSNYNLYNRSIDKKSKLGASSNITNMRSMYNDIFSLNQFRHSGVFEAVWAAFPTIIIISILIPSLVLLYSFEDVLNPKISVKVIANQWYWTYEFNNWVKFKDISDDKNVNISYAFNSNIKGLDLLNSGEKRLLEVDNRLVLPTNVTLRFLVSSSDVLHSFAMPELGFKIDANPGRLNQILVYINRPGVYYGQCSELCGLSHAFMPIVIQAILPSDFYSYLNKMQLKFFS